MRIAVPVGAFHRGNTSEYVLRAVQAFGYHGEILNHEQFVSAILGSEFDYYIAVDSGQPLNFLDPRLEDQSLTSVAHWFIDYRHNKDRTERHPTDFKNAEALDRLGGLILQAQAEDVSDCENRGLNRVEWLPLGADPEVWENTPVDEKRYDIGFVGNVWDHGRARALEALMKTPRLKFGFQGHGGAWKEEGAALLRACKIGFNVNSWFGEAHDYDINMRVFETLSCGIPLLTNEVPNLYRVLPEGAPFVRTFKSIGELPALVTNLLADEEFLQSGNAAREWILGGHTYVHRVYAALQMLGAILSAG